MPEAKYLFHFLKKKKIVYKVGFQTKLSIDVRVKETSKAGLNNFL